MQMRCLRNGDGEIGSEQFGSFPEAVEWRDDGARENVLENLIWWWGGKKREIKKMNN